MSDDKKQSAAAKKAAAAEAAKAAESAEQETVATDSADQPVQTVELPVNEPVADPVAGLDTGEAQPDQSVELQPVASEEHEKVIVIAVEVRSTLERRCRAGHVFGIEPVRIEGDALEALDCSALEADPYLHVEYITGTGDA